MRTPSPAGHPAAPGRRRPAGRPTSPPASAPWTGAALALAALAAATSFAAYQSPSSAAVETVYLGLLTTVVLAAAAALSPRPALAAGAGAALAVTILWALPMGERGAVLGLLLVAAFVVAALRRLDRDRGALTLAAAVPLALGAQTLLRGERWLDPLAGPRPLIGLVALPIAAALAVWLLAAHRQAAPATASAGRHGSAALLAAATAVLLAPGFNVAATLGLVALAAGREALAVDSPRWRRLVAFALLLAPLAWEPRAALVAAAAGLALGGGLLWLGVAGGVATALSLGFPLRPWPEALALLAWVPLLLPALVRPAGRWGQLAVAAVLAIAAARAVPGEAALAVPLALAALALPVAGPLAVAQRAWTAALFSGSALLALYPWLRREALADALGLTGIPPGWPAAALALVVATALTLTVGRLPPASGRGRPAAAAVIAGLALALIAAALSPVMVLIDGSPVVVSREQPLRALFLDDPLISEVVFDSHLVNAAALPAGIEVATLRLRDADDRVWELPLRVGEETGEWAARRADLAPRLVAAAPAPFRAELVCAGTRPEADAGCGPGTGGAFFALTYRARWRLPAPVEGRHIEIERNPELPEEVVLLLFRVELRP